MKVTKFKSHYAGVLHVLKCIVVHSTYVSLINEYAKSLRTLYTSETKLRGYRNGTDIKTAQTRMRCTPILEVTRSATSEVATISTVTLVSQ